ncbi:MAG TPA: DUF2950 domain-containing protein [Candidatus Acidoferrales bacterium]|nr:DUF2950 domain-containing protein [Candidatus Acidoferrales bacterium]
MTMAQVCITKGSVPSRRKDPMIERNEVMKRHQPVNSGLRAARNLLVTALALAAAALAVSPASWAQSGTAPHAAKKAAETKPAVQQKLFSTPEEAKDALVAAGIAKDETAMAEIFGPEHEKLRSSDPVQHQQHMERFAAHLQEACTLGKVAEGKYTVYVGANHFPFPIPIVKDGGKWRFDTRAGVEEILNRRIGEDELSAIMTCRAFVLAQWEYFTQGENDEDGLAQYARKFISTSGKHDGLYWDTAPGQEPSPLGPLVAQARAEGYAAGRSSGTPSVKPAKASTGNSASSEEPSRSHSPYHGYLFSILTRQGASAPGGAFSYLLNQHMIAGFALVAYPAEWGNSGVMTFIVNTQGRVYQKNLGPKTAEIAAAIKEYNPDPTWKLVPKD